MTDSYYLLERLCNLPGVAGFEGKQHLHPFRLRLHLTAPGRLLQGRPGV